MKRRFYYMTIYRIINKDGTTKTEIECLNILHLKHLIKCDMNNIMDSINNNAELRSGLYKGYRIQKILV